MEVLSFNVEDHENNRLDFNAETLTLTSLWIKL